jgi:hypothetical protein
MPQNLLASVGPRSDWFVAILKKLKILGDSGPRRKDCIMTTDDRSEMFRTRAIVGEQRGRESLDPDIKRQWEVLAIEWHALANFAATETGEITAAEPSKE